MKVLLFDLTGDMALWRNVYDSIGSFSCLGPAPSALAGLCGAALGFAAPRSQAAQSPDVKKLNTAAKHGMLWPVSPELLNWEYDNDYHVCCRWTGGVPIRTNWNVNGLKSIKEPTNLRIQQQVIEHPCYQVGVGLKSDSALDELAAALRCPAFPLYLGASFCPAIVRNVRVSDWSPEPSDGWAFRDEFGVCGEATPFSMHSISAGTTAFNRIKIDGYWTFPTPETPGILQTEPLVRGYDE